MIDRPPMKVKMMPSWLSLGDYDNIYGLRSVSRKTIGFHQTDLGSRTLEGSITTFPKAEGTLGEFLEANTGKMCKILCVRAQRVVLLFRWLGCRSPRGCSCRREPEERKEGDKNAAPQLAFTEYWDELHSFDLALALSGGACQRPAPIGHTCASRGGSCPQRPVGAGSGALQMYGALRQGHGAAVPKRSCAGRRA
jgi:hypothetical protein